MASTVGDRVMERERVRDANPLEEVVQDYFPLLQDGRTFKALCPFHSEKTPSFKVNPESGHYHCFGCNERGDVFSFVQKIENLDFAAALRFLADRAGVTLSSGGRVARGRDGGDEIERGRGYEILKKAQLFFQGQLARGSGNGNSGRQASPQEAGRDHGVTGSAALKYLQDRGFEQRTIEEFAVGFAPAAWSELTDALAREKVSAADTMAVGLARPRKQSQGAYDVFRGRIVFPIRGLQGKVLGFGGRILGGESRKEEPKYLNSPESQFFKKGQILYGLYEGRETIRRERRLLLMEGYTDVMMAHQAGFREAVATLGTALAEPNVEQVCRHADAVSLVFDGDRAGRAAARKAVWLFLPQPIEVRVVLLAGGQDPCDLLVDPRGVETFRKEIESGRGSLRFVLDELLSEFGSKTGEQRTRVAREFFPFLQRVPSEFRRLEGVQLLAAQLGATEDVVLREYQKHVQGVRKPLRRTEETSTSDPSGPGGELPGYEDAIVLCALSERERASRLFELCPPTRLRDPRLRVIGLELAEMLRGNSFGEPSPAGTESRAWGELEFEDTAVKSRFLSLREPLVRGQYEDEQAARLLRDVLVHRLSHRSRELRQRLNDAVEADRTPTLTELMTVRAAISKLRGAPQPSWEQLEQMGEEARAFG